MYTKNDLKIIKNALILAKKQNKYFNFYDDLISRTNKMIDEDEQMISALIKDIVKSSRGFTAEEFEMYSEMLKKKSKVVVEKAYDLNEN